VNSFQKTWKDKAIASARQVTDLQKNLSDQQLARTDEKTKLEADILAQKNRADLAEGKLSSLATDLSLANTARASAEQERDKHLADLQVAQQEAEARITETNGSRSEIKTLRDQMNDGIAQRRSLEDKLLDQQGRIDEAQQREEQMLKEIGRLRDLCRANRVDPNEPYVGPVPAAIVKVDGVVRQAKKNASRSAELVEISIGSDDQIEKKMKLIVYRGSRFICEIEITDVYPDMSVGRVIEETRNGSIERGDHVTTKL
jgi:chromosome segregation ATPase